MSKSKVIHTCPPRKFSSCAYCRHYNHSDFTCAAYPKKIPFDFLTGRKHHTKFTGDDNGVKFELTNDKWRRCFARMVIGDILKKLGYKLYKPRIFRDDDWIISERLKKAEKWTTKLETVSFRRWSNEVVEIRVIFKYVSEQVLYRLPIYNSDGKFKLEFPPSLLSLFKMYLFNVTGLVENIRDEYGIEVSAYRSKSFDWHKDSL